jgi:UDP-glucuronate 4-epimerase
MAHYLLTGVAGFIASRVAEMLLEDGHTVFGIDNLNDAYDVSLKEYRLGKLQTRPGFDFRLKDVTDREAVDEIGLECGPFDAVINLAARAGVRASVVDPWEYFNTNLVGTLNLLELCRHLNIPKFILASTSSIYGANAPLPTSESVESDRPLQPYAASKKAAEVLCHTYHYLYGIDMTIFRYFTVYGPAGRPDMSMFRFVQWICEGRPVQIYGDGEQSRGFSYVDDIARGTILGLKPVKYEIFNLGGHETITVIELVRRLEERIGKKAIIEYTSAHPADVSATHADGMKAGKILGWEPHVDLERGLELTIEWYLAEREWASRVNTTDQIT